MIAEVLMSAIFKLSGNIFIMCNFISSRNKLQNNKISEEIQCCLNLPQPLFSKEGKTNPPRPSFTKGGVEDKPPPLKKGE